MTPVEIIARYLCREDGRHPDGVYGDNAPPHWESYQRDAGDIINALAVANYVICRMPGGVHEGYCPTCGCEPVASA